MLIALVAGVVVSTWQAVRASRAERVAQARANDAQAEKAKAEAVTKFLTEMLASADPARAQGREVTVRAAVDEAARKIDAGAVAGQPDVEVSVRNAIGTTYEGLGLYEPAERELRTAIALQSRTHANPVLFADTNTRLVNVLYKAGKYTDAKLAAQEAVRLRKEALGPTHPDTATSLDDLGAILMVTGDAAGGEVLMREALAIRRAVLGPSDPQLAVSLNNLGFVLQEKRDLQQAETMLPRGVDHRQAAFGKRPPRGRDQTGQPVAPPRRSGKARGCRVACARRRRHPTQSTRQRPSGAHQRARSVGQHSRGAEPAGDRAAQARGALDRTPRIR